MSALRRQLARATTVFSSPCEANFITPARFTVPIFMSTSMSTTASASSASPASAFGVKYENIMTSPRAALVTLNSPKALNALNMALIAELTRALQSADADKEIGVIVITGSEKAFAGEHVAYVSSVCMVWLSLAGGGAGIGPAFGVVSVFHPHILSPLCFETSSCRKVLTDDVELNGSWR